jgi:hypothetical protein
VVPALLQAAQRVWSPEAVHDTVRAVVRDPAFRRSLQRTWLDRLLVWLRDFLHRLGKYFEHLPSMRTVGIILVGLLVLFVVVRVLVGAWSTREEETRRRERGRTSAADDPWAGAAALASAGQYEEAAHLLYRAVLSAISRDTRMRLDPSKTSGDYARELRRRNSGWLAPFRDFTRRFDRAVYGHGPCDERAYQELLALSAPFMRKALAA